MVNFDTPVEFLYYTEIYLKIRNALSHPALRKISYKDMYEICAYVNKIVLILEDKYLWYKEKDLILKQIEILYSNICNSLFKINNLHEILFSTRKIECGEEHISLLKKYKILKGGYLKRLGSVVVYRYGDVEETAFIFELLTELSKDIIDRSVTKDYNPQFLLLLTA
jgi:hypothetical protein